MNRYLLDTNIIVFYLFGERDNFLKETVGILSDYGSQLYTSSIAIGELIQLFRLKKIQSRKFKTAKDVVKAIEDEFFITLFFRSQNSILKSCLTSKSPMVIVIPSTIVLYHMLLLKNFLLFRQIPGLKTT